MMKTIFDYNPTDAELTELFFYDPSDKQLIPGTKLFPVPASSYDSISDDEKKLDVAQLLEYRGERDAAAQLWAQIPDLHRQWKGGFDNEMIPNNN